MKIKDIFNDNRIIGFAGQKHSGKSNNLVALIRDFRKENNTTPIYVYGFGHEVTEYLRQFDVIEVSSLKHIVNKKDCILIIDECQRLRLGDRRYKEELDDFVDFVYHNNVRVILSSPNLRDFNTILGSKIEGWILKSLDLDDLVNGSQLKKVVEAYKGAYKVFKSIVLPKSKILVINDDCETVLDFDYIEEVDTKKNNKDLFEAEIVNEKDRELSEELSIRLSDDNRWELPFNDRARWYS